MVGPPPGPMSAGQLTEHSAGSKVKPGPFPFSLRRPASFYLTRPAMKNVTAKLNTKIKGKTKQPFTNNSQAQTTPVSKVLCPTRTISVYVLSCT